MSSNLSEFYKNHNYSSIFLRVYKKAEIKYHAKYKNGIEHGFFSPVRHYMLSSRSKKLKTDLEKISKSKKSSSNNWEALYLVASYIKSHGSLWDAVEGHNHSFSNYFLIELHADSSKLYRRTIGTAYGVRFLENHYILYRRDNRSPGEIEQAGGVLLKSENAAKIRKTNYSEYCTNAHGISLSKNFQLFDSTYSDYGNYCYKIEFLHNHRHLLIDILESENKIKAKQPTNYQLGLQEVNSIGDLCLFDNSIIISCWHHNSWHKLDSIHNAKHYYAGNKVMGCYYKRPALQTQTQKQPQISSSCASFN